MKFKTRKFRFWAADHGRQVGSILVALLFLVGTWVWGFWRFYVPPDYLAVVIAKIGEPLRPGQILAEPGQKGIQEFVLGEGRYFRNPIFYDWEILPVTLIPPGKVAIITSKIGSDLPSGEFLANRGQKGIWRNVLGSGKYRLNPYGYNVELIDALSIPIGYVGVVTGLSGKQAVAGEFAGPGEKGVREDVLHPGLYYVNPKALQVDVLEIGVNQVSLVGKKGGEVITKDRISSQNAAIGGLQDKVLAEQHRMRSLYFAQRDAQVAPPTPPPKVQVSPELESDSFSSSSRGEERAAAPMAKMVRKSLRSDTSVEAILSLDQMVEFPSRDGFEISLDMTVEFELLPEHIAWVYRGYGDLPAVVDKIIMPQILSVSRLKGSAYHAKDFIVGEGREKFQKDLTEALAHVLIGKHILVHNALIRQVNAPLQILDPIQQSSIAVEQNLTNAEKQNTARKQADLNTELSLIDQAGERVAQETERMKAEIKADQEKQVAQTKAESLRRVSEIEKETALLRAERTRKLGEAKAQVVTLVEGAKAAGLGVRMAAFQDPAAYTLWTFANSLSDDLSVRVLHAGQGTLWTDIEKSSLGDLAGARTLTH
ncbi:putative Band 7 protein [Gammaproteobacteria bacterium]